MCCSRQGISRGALPAGKTTSKKTCIACFISDDRNSEFSEWNFILYGVTSYFSYQVLSSYSEHGGGGGRVEKGYGDVLTDLVTSSS